MYIVQITHIQIKMARIGVGYTVRDLAAATGLSANAVSSIENGRVAPLARTLYALVQALEEAGAEFGEPNWVNIIEDDDY